MEIVSFSLFSYHQVLSIGVIFIVRCKSKCHSTERQQWPCMSTNKHPIDTNMILANGMLFCRVCLVAGLGIVFEGYDQGVMSGVNISPSYSVRPKRLLCFFLQQRRRSYAETIFLAAESDASRRWRNGRYHASRERRRAGCHLLPGHARRCPHVRFRPSPHISSPPLTHRL